MELQLQTLLRDALHAVLEDKALSVDQLPAVVLEVPRNPEHGDFSTNIALASAKKFSMAPRDLAAAIVAQVSHSELVERVEMAGPGFINLHVATQAFTDVIAEILAQGTAFGRSDKGHGQRVQIEYVSANPTGPLHVGHGRGAAYGAALANIMRAAGYEVVREYYVNDAGRQMDILALSVLVRYLQSAGLSVNLPSNAYQGEYITAMGRELWANHTDTFIGAGAALNAVILSGELEADLDALIGAAKDALGASDYATLHAFARDDILDGIRTDLGAFGVEFDHWFYESSLANDGAIEDAVGRLRTGEYAYEKDAALWFKSTAFGDEKDRVVVRDNGSPTYFASDIAYHQNKFARDFDHLINIWGADHHGYIARVKAAIEALGLDPARLEVLLVQFAVLYRGGEKVPMSTRSGEFVTLAELIDEVGCDAARYFYAMRRSEQHLDFDLDLAKSQKNENPVYYVQYAHARICGVLAKLTEKGLALDTDLGLAKLALLLDEREKSFASVLRRYPEVLAQAVDNREPHLLTNYLRELATEINAYHGSDVRILVDDDALRNARLVLNLAARQVLRNALDLLGVGAPETM